MALKQTTLKSFDFAPEDIGVGLLESITTGLYREPGDVLREYISNEIDNTPPPRFIEVRTDAQASTVTVLGDGPGMDWESFRNAVRIGISFKDPKTNVGFRGIGIWAGLAACDELIIATKSDHDPNEYELHVDCKALRALYQGKNRHTSLVEALNQCAGYETRKSTREHGTEVTLKGILPAFRDLLVETKVRDYLTRECPLAFEDGFPHAETIQKHLTATVPHYRRVKMTLNGTAVKGLSAPAGMKEPQFGEIHGRVGDNPRNQLLGIYWLSHAERTNVIDPAYDRGLRIRVRNFTVVDPGGVQGLLQREGATNLGMLNYWIGEVHAIHPDFKPNAERRDLENSEAKAVLYNHIVNDLYSETMVKWSRNISAITNLKEDLEDAEDVSTAVKQSDFPDVVAAEQERAQVEKTMKDIVRQHKDILLKIKGVTAGSALHKEMDSLASRAQKAAKKLEKRHEKLKAIIETLRAETSRQTSRGGNGRAKSSSRSSSKADGASETSGKSSEPPTLADDLSAQLASYERSPTKLAKAIIRSLLDSGMSGSQVRSVVNKAIKILQRER